MMQQQGSIVKRLDRQTRSAAAGRDSPARRASTEKQYVTVRTLEREEAVEKKLKLLRGSLFGKPIMKFQVGQVTDVWVPYCYLEYRFIVERSILFKKKGLEKNGEVGLVFDMNEMHPFQYDLYESGQLPLKKESLGKEKKIIRSENAMDEVKAKAEDYIQYKIMRKFYGAEGKLALKRNVLFYRPAVELEIIYKGENKNQRYAYLDEFSVDSEHILGLKYRVDNHF
ncbi:hypothetical protein D3Z38_11105 [Clostridiales bacterium]|nr:hypothetical protein [Clostridiales bacterium]